MAQAGYRVLAREKRPKVFSEVVAQSHIVQTLQNAIRQGRIAHAYLFSGPRGTGKTTVARLLAKALNCEKGPTPEPCGDECQFCRAIRDGKSMDVLEIDGASNRGIDEIRQLREEVGYAATRGKRKVYIIDEVHMLTPEAFNALLKTLEEPPPHVIFVFATTEPHKVPDTILSRCQRYNFRRIPTEEIAGRLRRIVEGREAEGEAREAEEEALFLIARKADGAMRDALSLLDQVCAFSGGPITAQSVRDLLGLIPRDLYFDLMRAVLEQDGAGALGVVARVVEEGGDVGEFTEGLLEHLRHLLVARVAEGVGVEDLPEADRTRYAEFAGQFREDDLVQMLQVVSELELNLNRVAEPRFWLELTVMKLVKMADSVALSALLSRLERLEGMLKERSGAPSGASGGSAQAAPAALRRPPERGRNGAQAARPGADVSPEVRTARPPGAGDAGKPPAASGRAAAPPPPKAPAGEVTLASIQASWDDLVEAVKQRKISVGTFLAAGRPQSLDGQQVVVAFKRSGVFHSNQVQRNRETVEEVAAQVFGAPLRIVCRVGDEAEAEAVAVAEEAERPEDDERIQMALRIFDGEIVRR